MLHIFPRFANFVTPEKKTQDIRYLSKSDTESAAMSISPQHRDGIGESVKLLKTITDKDSISNDV